MLPGVLRNLCRPWRLAALGAVVFAGWLLAVSFGGTASAQESGPTISSVSVSSTPANTLFYLIRGGDYRGLAVWGRLAIRIVVVGQGLLQPLGVKSGDGRIHRGLGEFSCQPEASSPDVLEFQVVEVEANETAQRILALLGHPLAVPGGRQHLRPEAVAVGARAPSLKQPGFGFPNTRSFSSMMDMYHCLSTLLFRNP